MHVGNLFGLVGQSREVRDRLSIGNDGQDAHRHQAISFSAVTFENRYTMIVPEQMNPSGDGNCKISVKPARLPVDFRHAVCLVYCWTMMKYRGKLTTKRDLRL